MPNLTKTRTLTHNDLTTVIIRDPIAVLPTTPLRDAIALMSGARSHCEADSTAQAESNPVQLEARASCVIVVEAQRVVGILTERDVVRLCAQRQALESLLVGQVMTASVLTLQESALRDLFSVVNLLQQKHIRHLPVVNEQDCLVGMLTHEILRQMIQPTDLLRLRLVQEVMTQAVLTAAPTDSLFAIAQYMAHHRVSSVVVIDRDRPEDLPVPVGLVTERDLVQFQALELDFERYPVAQVMSSPVITVSETETLAAVQQLMERYFVRRVVVTGGLGELLGIVTQSNVLQALSPLELYKLTEILEARVDQLEAEKLDALHSRNLALEAEVTSRTAHLQKQLQREQVVTHLTTQIRASLSLQTILETAVEQIHRIIDCDRVNIWKFEPDLCAVVVAEATNSSLSLMGERVWDECYQEHLLQVYREGRVRVVPDIYTTEMTDCHRELLIRLHTRAKVLLPLFCGAQLWGLLNVAENQTARDWQADEIELLRNLANQITIAIQQASVHHQLQSELQERQQAETLLQIKNDLLARVIAQEPLTDTLDGACTEIEQMLEGAMCSILLLDSHNRLRDGAAPSLPDDYRRQIDGVQVGEGVGSCGTAVHRREKVIVADIANDPLWRDFKDLAVASGLRACWSTPIVAADQSILGTFAVYYHEVHSPSVDEIALVDSFIHVVMLAIQRHQSEIALKQTNQKLQEAQRLAHLGNWELDLQHNTLYWSEETFRIFEVDPQQFDASYEAFLELVHPDDRTLVDETYANHLRDRQPYSLVHRLQLNDGRIKYVCEKCETSFSADGTPLISRGTVQDITQQQEAEIQRDRAEASMRQVIEGAAAFTGEEFFSALVRYIGQVLGVRCVSVGQATSEGFQVLAVCADGELYFPQFLPYDLVPCCYQSLQAGSCCHPNGLQALYPGNPLFADLQAESYLGVSLRNTAGEPMGSLCIFHDAPLADPDWAQTLLSTFAGRAGAELERFLTVQALEQLNAELEARVAQRTADLAEREARYRGLLEGAPDAILLADLQGNLVEANHQAEMLFGYPLAELTTLHFTQLHPPEALPRVTTVFAEVAQSQRTQVLDVNCCRRDGRIIPVDITATVIHLHGETLVQGIVRDISERKVVEQALQAENAFRQLVLENLAEGLCVCHSSPDYPFVQFTVWNSQMEAITGYTQAEINELGWYQTLYPDPEIQAQAIARMTAMRQGASIQAEEWTIRHRDGRDRTIAITTSLLPTAGEHPNILAVMQDVTERRQVEQERQHLLQELTGFKLGLDQAALVAMTDADGVITYVNQKLVEVSGYSETELIGQTHRLVKSCIHPRSFFQNLWQTIRRGEVWRGEICNRAKDGRLYWVDSTILPFCNAQGEPERYLAIRLDITEQKKARMALQESQQFLQMVLDTVPLSVFWKDRESHYLGANQLFLRNAALSSASELVGKTDFDLPWRETQAEAYRADDRFVMDRGEAKLDILEIQHLQDGTDMWVETNKLPIRNLAGEVVGVLGTYQDITARREAEIAMRRQSVAIEAAVNGIAILQDEQYVYLNSSHVELFGYQNTQELLGQSWRVLYSPEELDRFDREIWPALCERMFWQGEVTATRKDGTTFPQQLSLTLTADNLLICVCQDISDRKAAELALQDSETRFRRVFESNVVGMMFTNFSGQVTDANDRFLDIIGYSRADLEANRINWAQITPPEYVESDQRAIEQLQRHGEILPWEKEYLRLDGSRVSVLIGVALLSAIEGRCVCVVLDISELKAAEAELRRTNLELERATRLKDEFLANMSHELRTPLNAILGMTEGLQEEVFGPISDRQRRSLNTIEHSGTHLLSLINDILDLSKIEAAQLELEFTAIDVGLLCDSSLTFVKQQAHKRHLHIETQIPGNLPDLYGDERRLRQVLINLLINAVKFTPEEGHITLSATYTPLPPEETPHAQDFVHPQAGAAATVGILTLSIADTGIGISPENAKKLFQPFVQVDSALNRQHQGTGLGLALVKRITEMHGGKVELTSKVGVGSCFALQLPIVAITSRNAAAVDLTTAVETSASLDPITAPLILLAEDNEANINTTTAYLTAKGYYLVVARNGLEAVHLARITSPNLILMDIQMPQLDGLEAIQQIRQIPALTKVPIVALTALAMPDDRERCLAAGADEYISKPVRLRHLSQMIQTMLASPPE